VLGVEAASSPASTGSIGGGDAPTAAEAVPGADMSTMTTTDEGSEWGRNEAAAPPATSYAPQDCPVLQPPAAAAVLPVPAPAEPQLTVRVADEAEAEGEELDSATLLFNELLNQAVAAEYYAQKLEQEMEKARARAAAAAAAAAAGAGAGDEGAGAGAAADDAEGSQRGEPFPDAAAEAASEGESDVEAGDPLPPKWTLPPRRPLF
jgi:hypothetical protein